MQHKHPFPWWMVVHATSLAAASLAVRRAVSCIAIAYWAGGCAGLPDDDASIAGLAGIHSMTWREQRHAIMAAFATVKPPLDKAWIAVEVKRAKLSARGRRLRAIQLAGIAPSTQAQVTMPRVERTPAHVIGVPSNPVTPPLPQGLFRE